MNTKVNQEGTHYKSNKYTGFFFLSFYSFVCFIRSPNFKTAFLKKLLLIQFFLISDIKLHFSK